MATTKLQLTDGVHNISNEDYHAASGISRSKLLLMDKSPYHFWYEVYSGVAEKKDPSPSMNVGSAFHTLLLEPELFAQEFAVAPKMDRRTTAGKEQYNKFMELSEGKIVLTDDQYAKASVMANHIKQHEIVTTLLDDSVFEQSIFWTDKETGIQFKSRPDIWSSKMVVDLKTTADASIHGFTRSALNYGYYLQAGMAFEACKAIGKPFEMFVILAAEKEAPYVPAVLIMDQEALKFGIAQFHSYKTRLKICLDSNKWPGYPVQELKVPSYAKIDAHEEEELVA
jgi:exodeoxyribonuclease VIII